MYKNNFTRPAENETPIEIEIINDFSQNQEDFWQYFTRLTPNRQHQANIYYYNDDVLELPPEIEELRDLDDSEIMDKIPSGYALHRSVGYCQGDIAYVIYKEPESMQMNQCIDSILWDAPVYIEIRVGNEVLTNGDLLNDTYNYSKEEVISHYDDPKVRQFLEEHLPNSQAEI